MTEGLSRLFLQPSGWQRSRDEQSPVRADGRPLPWLTYGAIEFLHRVVLPTDRVFEFGAGHSTLWWQEAAHTVVAVEHDSQWCDQLRPHLAVNATLLQVGMDAPLDNAALARCAPFFELPRRTEWDYDGPRVARRGLADERFQAYAYAIEDATGEFDFVIVDGMARRLCTWLAISRVKEEGFLVLDNSNRSDYHLAFQILSKAGFRQIPFWGLVPGADFLTCTSFFTRSMARIPTADFVGNSFGLPEY